ncbi:hypothetical protein Cst_c18550 [Thermoclostridium stercorarium subsp. stercorarium DSM 8532]|uniref:Uncharacterized protein n=1 Tax=Thermoclostridium stercorarium (strain ATCC 35414 / DSM 8532 / NCIMB 11754) TaxID=1121335 RepID=L7VPV0_THES1|nr:hypothetical protein Cst_c18550 [Thermoclostridium stercorarium subsp. stercorarium DSM 8532]
MAHDIFKIISPLYMKDNFNIIAIDCAKNEFYIANFFIYLSLLLRVYIFY